MQKAKYNTAEDIRLVCNELAEMLIEKNNSYGDSALEPTRCFSRGDKIELINIRLDDKISRLMKGNGETFREDVEKDIMGYLVLKRIALKRASGEIPPIGQEPENIGQQIKQNQQLHRNNPPSGVYRG